MGLGSESLSGASYGVFPGGPGGSCRGGWRVAVELWKPPAGSCGLEMASSQWWVSWPIREEKEKTSTNLHIHLFIFSKMTKTLLYKFTNSWMFSLNFESRCVWKSCCPWVHFARHFISPPSTNSRCTEKPFMKFYRQVTQTDKSVTVCSDGRKVLLYLLNLWKYSA